MPNSLKRLLRGSTTYFFTSLTSIPHSSSISVTKSGYASRTYATFWFVTFSASLALVLSLKDAQLICSLSTAAAALPLFRTLAITSLCEAGVVSLGGGGETGFFFCASSLASSSALFLASSAAIAFLPDSVFAQRLSRTAASSE